MTVDDLKAKRQVLYTQIIDGCPSYMGTRIDRVNYELFKLTGDAKYLFGLGAFFMERVSMEDVQFFKQ